MGGISGSNVPVVLTGESGTGKNLIARLIHLRSTRCDGPFVMLRCDGHSTRALHPLLFGHENDRSTAPKAWNAGAIELADRGTLVLEDLSALEPSLERKLLRYLVEGTFERLGSRKILQSTARLISVHTHSRDNGSKVRTQQKVAKLMDGINTHLPALRERRGDIRYMSNYFLERCTSQFRHQPRPLTPDNLRSLEEHSWPGNIVELENVIRRYVLLNLSESCIPETVPFR